MTESHGIGLAVWVGLDLGPSIACTQNIDVCKMDHDNLHYLFFPSRGLMKLGLHDENIPFLRNS